METLIANMMLLEEGQESREITWQLPKLVPVGKEDVERCLWGQLVKVWTLQCAQPLSESTNQSVAGGRTSLLKLASDVEAIGCRTIF